MLQGIKRTPLVLLATFSSNKTSTTGTIINIIVIMIMMNSNNNMNVNVINAKKRNVEIKK